MGSGRGAPARVGAPHPSLTGVSGMAAVTELCEQLTVVAGVGWRGEDHLVGLGTATLAF